MSKRTFELPGIHELSKEQDAVLALPKEGKHLIIGGPGTGKSVMTLLRLKRYDNGDHAFLVYNHLLRLATIALHGGDFGIATWNAWLDQQFKAITGKNLPLGEPKSGNWRPVAWPATDRIVAQTQPIEDTCQVVIDEGQDMPPEFYRTLTNLGFENLFVAADQNQQITDDHSSRQQLEDELGIDAPDVIELRRNYRNSAPVARLARAFYTDDPASPPPDMPLRPGVPAWLCVYHDTRFAELCERIVRLVDVNPRRLVGVIAPNNAVRDKYYRQLKQAAPRKLDHGLPAISTFYGNHRPNVRFDEGGILVINAQACKGLEFDVAVLADVDQHRHDPTDEERSKKLFYVMVARAREQVILLRKDGQASRIDDILPDDPEILKRRDIARRPR